MKIINEKKQLELLTKVLFFIYFTKACLKIMYMIKMCFGNFNVMEYLFDQVCRKSANHFGTQIKYPLDLLPALLNEY